MQFFSALEGVLTIMLMVSLGYVLTVRHWFSADAKIFISRMVNYISLPTYMIWNLTTSFTRESFAPLIGTAIVPTLSMIIAYICGYFLAKLLRLPREKAGIWRSAFFCSSAIFVGVPINLALFGESSIPYVLIYFLPNAFLFWTIGNYSISLSGTSAPANIFSLQTVRKICSPPFMSFSFAVLLIYCNITFPTFVNNTLKYLGSMTTPLSMMFVGIAMGAVKFKQLRFSKDIWVLLFGRFIMAPGLVWLVSLYIPIPELMRKVFIIQAALPAMTQTSVMAKIYGADDEYAALLISITTIVSLISIPIYMMII